jgi:hypothetical protein
MKSSSSHTSILLLPGLSGAATLTMEEVLFSFFLRKGFRLDREEVFSPPLHGEEEEKELKCVTLVGVRLLASLL